MESKVLLTLPPDPGASFTMPDLGLGYIASSLRAVNIPVSIIHSINESLELNQLINRISNESPAIVGIKFFSKDFHVTKCFLQMLKKRLPGVITIGGGPHPSCSHPQELMEQFANLDYAFRGEAEIGIVPLVNMLLSEKTSGKLEQEKLQHVPGLVWRDNGKTMCNPPGFTMDLDKLGFPAWDLIDPRNFSEKYEFSIFTRPPSANIIATRGCPYQCTFCATSLTTGKRVRRRSITNLLDEITMLQEQYGIKTINFIDDNFTFQKKFVRSFCEEVLRRNMKFEWHCPYGVRLNSLDPTLVKLMEKSGCISLAVGIESGSPRILKHMRKKLTVEKIREQIDMIKSNSNLKVQGFFILGYPGETREDIIATINFARSLQLDMASFSLFCPIPGTPIYQQMVDDGKLSGPLKWEDYTMDSVVYAPESISLGELNRYHRTAYMKFYLRPKIIMNLLKQMKSGKQLRFLFWGFFHRLLLHKPQKNYHLVELENK